MLSAWSDRFRDFRNRKVADPAFRRWASRFALTRPVARRQARALFDLTAGFVYSQILYACVRVDLFQKLAAGPLSVAAVAHATGLPPFGAERLLKAAAALDLVESRSGERYALGPLGAALVGNDGVTAMIAHHRILYEDLRDPLSLLAGTAKAGLQNYWAYAGGECDTPAEPRRHGDYTALMAASQAFVTAEILDAYSLERHGRLLDVGGGDASFLIAASRVAPELDLMLFDLPPVAAIAGQRLNAAGLAGRARAYGGSFLVDPLPSGADLVTLNRVLHDHDDDAALAILRAIRRAIAPGGTLLVVEPMAGTPGAEASGDAYFGFYLLAMGQGRPRTAAEISAMLVRAGFETIGTVATNTPMIARIVSAKCGAA
ncbi:MAG: methyltransferase [Mesorhizobium sp.]|nr:methyltransferase [Mesorhizobium sp.]